MKAGVMAEQIPTTVVPRVPEWEMRGRFDRGPVGVEVAITNWQQFEDTFGTRGEAVRNAYDFFKYAVGAQLLVTRVEGEP
jgi:hypothetical protein